MFPGLRTWLASEFCSEEVMLGFAKDGDSNVSH